VTHCFECGKLIRWRQIGTVQFYRCTCGQKCYRYPSRLLHGRPRFKRYAAKESTK